jgi:hypothetical protein
MGSNYLKKLYNEEPQSVLFTKCYSGHQIEKDEMDRESCVEGNYKQASGFAGKMKCG